MGSKKQTLKRYFGAEKPNQQGRTALPDIADIEKMATGGTPSSLPGAEEKIQGGSAPDGMAEENDGAAEGAEAAGSSEMAIRGLAPAEVEAGDGRTPGRQRGEPVRKPETFPARG